MILRQHGRGHGRQAFRSIGVGCTSKEEIKNMAPYKEKVEFEPKRKHGLIRTTSIWISGLIASFLFAKILADISQQYLIYKCVAALKSLDSCPDVDRSLATMFGIAAVFAFICVRLWVKNGKS